VAQLLVGPALLVAADTWVRLVLSPTQSPVGIVIGLIGGSYCHYLMHRQEQLDEL
jgi:ABC-type Fe3+-siderophore transport system permease subunit